MTLHIDVINKSTVVGRIEMLDICRAIEQQARHDFAPAYGTDPAVVINLATHQGIGHWVVFVLDDSDQAGALGYHEISDTAQPIGKVFAATDKKYGLSISVTMSHEIMEMLGDPFAAQCYQLNTSTFGAWEVCDPVESDALGYMIGDVRVSDFVLPSWFVGGPGPWSFKGNVSGPHRLASGGYVSLWSQSTGWTQQVAKREGTTSRSDTMSRHFERALASYVTALLPVDE